MTWIGHVTHKYYKPEELLFPTVRIKHVSSGFTKELTLAINPWDLFATFGRDRRVLTDEYVDSLREVGTVQGSSKGREKIPSLFFINQFSYHTLRFRYEIDEFMNLNVKKMLLWRVDPSVLRYSSIVNGRRATEHLRDGIYLLKAAVQKDYLDPAARGVSIGRDPYSGETRLQLSEEVKKKQYITAVKKLVRVQDGKIITPVEIAMRDLRLMRIRSNMLVQLETIDEKELTKVSILHEELRKLGKERQLKAENGGSEAEYRNFMAAKMRPVYNYVRELSELEMNKPGRLSTPDDFAKFYDEMDELKDLPADFFSKVKDKTLQAYKKNDLTYMPTAPIVDLDSLRDLDSGLEPRVFSGPVTLLLNSNSSYMRPTDNLDEIYCPSSDDCDRIKKELADLHGGKKEDTEYRDSPFFGSIKHLYRKAVDRVIEDMMKLEENYRARNSVASLLYTFVRDYNLTYISLKDKPLIKFDTDKCKTVDDNIPEKGNCLSRTTEGMMPIDQFINEINVRRFANKPIEAEELLGVIDGEALDVRLTSRLCNWIAARAEQVWKESKGPRINAAGGIHLRQDLFWQCISNQLSWERRPDKHTPTFIVERKYKIYQTGDYRFKGGKSMNLNVGASFSLNHSESFSFGKSYNLLGPLNGIPYVGAILSPAALRLSSDESKSRSDGTSISEQAFLVMQQATMDLELLRYEKCAIVRMHPDRFNEIPMFYFGSRGDSEGDRKVLSEITRGLMFCKGEEETKPIAVRERYYYFTQHFTEGDQLDSSDLYNHPWLLGLRGVRDFHTFVALLKAVPYNWKLDAVVEEEGWALQHMMNTYREIHPTFPGLYSILSTEEDKLEYPFEDRPHNSFANGWKKKPVGEGEGRLNIVIPGLSEESLSQSGAS